MTTKLLIFGITGDLSTRKLIPALKEIVATGEFDDLEIIGVSRREVEVKALMGDLAARSRVITMNLAELDDYKRLKNELDLSPKDQLLAYLSVPPRAATQIVDFMGEAGINERVKILFEKPFGVDLASAKEMIERTSRYFEESQLYRIDHYIAKEMAQNIAAFRYYNAVFAHNWNSNAIERIEINAFENIDIEGRGQFYEQTGALRDVVQGHLMQLLSLVLMDIPHDLDWKKVPQYREQALDGIVSVDPKEALRAQYEGYQQEVENPGSCIETFVRLVLHSTAERWSGVPLVLTTGKALDKKCTEIKVHFKKTHPEQTNCLTFRIQPHEGVEIALHVKRPGYAYEIEDKTLAFSYPDDVRLPDAYEQVIVDAIRSRKSLFTSSAEVLKSWEILQPLVNHWAMCNPDGVVYYQKGTAAIDIV